MHVEDESLKAPSRIGTIRMTMTVETDADDRRVRTLERVAGACKIHTTLQKSPEVVFEFNATQT
jgi:hypothetical protein